jgi:hypothetical protein
LDFIYDARPRAKNCGSGRRNELLVALAAALGCEKIIIAATKAVRIFAANPGPRIVDGAAALLRVEEHANFIVYVVRLLPEHAVAVSDFGVPRFGRLV